MSRTNQLFESIELANREFQTVNYELKRAEKELKVNELELQEITKQIELFEEARIFLQELAEVARHEIASGLEQVVTLCLQAVFGENMSFEIDIETSRNTTAIQFYVVNSNGEQVVRFSPEESMGGGVVDTVSIGLRFGLLKILNPEPVGPIILDEPAKMVSGDLIDSIASLLKELTQMFDKQNILVTHHTSLMDVVDNAIYLEQENGVSRVTSYHGP